MRSRRSSTGRPSRSRARSPRPPPGGRRSWSSSPDPALAVAIAHHAAVARQLGDSRGTEGILMPVCVLLLGAVVLASAVAAWWRGGVVWRGTHYPLDRVREGCLRDGELPVSGAIGWGGDS